MSGEVNIPLLRKVVEWAEAEAAKESGGLWIQKWWRSTPDSTSAYVQAIRAEAGLDEHCGTAYCIAGYVCEIGGLPGFVPGREAAEALGIGESTADRLFEADNTIADVRRIAEDIAGERL